MTALLLALVLSQEATRSWGPELSASTGLEAALGDARTGQKLWSVANGGVPVGLELGMRVANRWFVGGYAHCAPTMRMPADSPTDALESYASGPAPLHVRAGALVQLHLWADEKLAPFVGLGFGYQWLGVLHGFEGSLQVGGELRLSSAIFLGAALVGHLGRFDFEPYQRGSSTRPDAVAVEVHGELHGWAGIAMRVRFSL